MKVTIHVRMIPMAVAVASVIAIGMDLSTMIAKEDMDGKRSASVVQESEVNFVIDAIPTFGDFKRYPKEIPDVNVCSAQLFVSTFSFLTNSMS